MPGKILIVDDDRGTVEMLSAVLRDSGFITRAATTGEDGLRTATKSPPDLVLLDLMLPDTNGFTVCEKLRKTRSTSSVPVILLTALPGELPRLAGVEAGADAYVRKPFPVSELLTTIDKVLRHGHQAPREILAPGAMAA